MKKQEVLDQLKAFHQYAQDCANALNAAGVTKPEGYGCALMIITHPEDENSPGMPLGGALNWYDGKWQVDQQLQIPEPA